MPARAATPDFRLRACLLRALSLVIATLAWALTAHASPPPRPDINDYTDTQAFVADMLNWQHQHGTATDGMAPPSGQGNEEDSGRYEKPWHRVTGPEDLEQAVRNADGYEQPRYPEPHRFDRTTHISFPLPPLPAERMASEALEGALYSPPGNALEGLSHPPLQWPGDDDERLYRRAAPPPALPPMERDTAVRVQLR